MFTDFQNKIYKFSMKYKDFLHKCKLFTELANLLALNMEKL